MEDTIEKIYAKLDTQLIGELLCLQEEIGDLLTFIDERAPAIDGVDRLAVYELDLSNYMAEVLRMKELIATARNDAEIVAEPKIEGGN